VPDAKHLYTGHERDLGATSSELDVMHARYYIPEFARFASVDTVGGDPSSSQSWNRYSYTRGNPLRAVDPTGLYEEDVHRSLTAVLALAVGFDPKAAREISAVNQAVDDNPTTNAFSGGLAARRGYHFTSQARRDELWAAFESSKTVEALGVFVHAEQDGFAHAGFGPSRGHVARGHVPDKTANDPGKADQMTATTYVKLVAAAEVMGLDTEARIPFSAISQLVQEFNDARSLDEKDRIIQRMELLVTDARRSSQNP
jgi:RHS repeat-associated protein